MSVVRLPGREYRSGNYRRIAATPYFLLKGKPRRGRSWRAGIIAGSAVHKSAAKRNFWKRIARETLCANLPQRGEPLDVLLILSPQVNNLTKKQFCDTLAAAVRRAAAATEKKT